ncbi:hypothetical protein SDC9_200820 [bioreactor metagenome]|uniref:SIR2-like domain-containing protein n=1 Tax=bioreactor metagenome TaxID=1076179 RepID=A0A645IPZ9_9ZZZZ
MNDAYRLGHHKDCMQLINKTDLFILFGLSYGDTDKTWWNLIGEKLMNFKESILIVFHFDYNFKDTGHKGPDREDLEDSIKELISKKMGINDSDYKLIENRIIVAINTDIFKIPYPKSLLP